MPKVVTSEGLTEFVQTGKHQNIAPLKAGEAPKLETVKATPTVDVKPVEAQAKTETPDKKALETTPNVSGSEDELTAEEQALPDKAKKEILRSKKAVNEKHRLMMEAKEAAEEADRLAESQYNERRLAEQRAEAAEARLKELEAKANPPPPAPKEPNIEDYKLENGNYDWVKFQKDTSEYTRKQALEDFRKEQAEEKAKADLEAHRARLAADADRARQKHPDFDEVMARIKGSAADTVPQFVLSYIQESDNSAEIAYHLAKNPEVSQKISKLKPILGIAELGKLEAALVQPPSASASRSGSVTTRTNGGAPAPITPLDGEGEGHINTDPSKMSYKELRAWHKAREAERRKR